MKILRLVLVSGIFALAACGGGSGQRTPVDVADRTLKTNSADTSQFLLTVKTDKKNTRTCLNLQAVFEHIGKIKETGVRRYLSDVRIISNSSELSEDAIAIDNEFAHKNFLREIAIEEGRKRFYKMATAKKAADLTRVFKVEQSDCSSLNIVYTEAADSAARLSVPYEIDSSSKGLKIVLKNNTSALQIYTLETGDRLVQTQFPVEKVKLDCKKEATTEHFVRLENTIEWGKDKSHVKISAFHARNIQMQIDDYSDELEKTEKLTNPNSSKEKIELDSGTYTYALADITEQEKLNCDKN